MRVFKSIGLYSLSSFIQKSIGFFLLPVYTSVLLPEDYGVISVVTTIASVLFTLFTISLPSAITRFYVDYSENHSKLAIFISTLIYFLVGVNAIALTLMLLFGENIFYFVLGKIEFYPYMVLALLSVFGQLLYNIALGLLQIQEKPKEYIILSLSFVLLNVSCVLYYLLIQKEGVIGYLLANLFSSTVFSFISLWHLRSYLTFKFDLKMLRSALKYSLPIVPYSVSSYIATSIDRILLNGILNAGMVGIYSIANTLSLPIKIITTSVNMAFVPIYYRACTNNSYREIIEISKVFIWLYNVMAITLSLFAYEIVFVFLDPKYLESVIIIPILAFTFAVYGLYYIFINIFFYEKRATNNVSIITIISLGLNVILNLILIPTFDILGSAFATFFTQVVIAVYAAVFGKRHEKVSWNYWQFFISYLVSILIGWLPLLFFQSEVSWLIFLMKTVMIIIAVVLLNFILWKRIDGPIIYYVGKYFKDK